jgi:hypothetical protein
MIDPFHRSSSVIRTLAEEIIKIAAEKDEITDATSHMNTRGQESETFTRYKHVGFSPIKSPKPPEAEGSPILADNRPMQSQGLKSGPFVAMKADFEVTMGRIKKF